MEDASPQAFPVYCEHIYTENHQPNINFPHTDTAFHSPGKPLQFTSNPYKLPSSLVIDPRTAKWDAHPIKHPPFTTSSIYLDAVGTFKVPLCPNASHSQFTFSKTMTTPIPVKTEKDTATVHPNGVHSSSYPLAQVLSSRNSFAKPSDNLSSKAGLRCRIPEQPRSGNLEVACAKRERRASCYRPKIFYASDKKTSFSSSNNALLNNTLKNPRKKATVLAGIQNSIVNKKVVASRKHGFGTFSHRSAMRLLKTSASQELPLTPEVKLRQYLKIRVSHFLHGPRKRSFSHFVGMHPHRLSLSFHRQADLRTLNRFRWSTIALITPLLPAATLSSSEAPPVSTETFTLKKEKMEEGKETSDSFLALQEAAVAFHQSFASKNPPLPSDSLHQTISSPQIETFLYQMHSKAWKRDTPYPWDSATYLSLLKKRDITIRSQRSSAEKLNLILLGTLQSADFLVAQTMLLYPTPISASADTLPSVAAQKAKIFKDSETAFFSRRITLFAATHLVTQHYYKLHQLFPFSLRPTEYPFSPTFSHRPLPSSYTQEKQQTTVFSSLFSTAETSEEYVDFDGNPNGSSWYARLRSSAETLQTYHFYTHLYGYEKARRLAYELYDETLLLREFQKVTTSPLKVPLAATNSIACLTPASSSPENVPEGIYILRDHLTQEELAVYVVVPSQTDYHEKLLSICRNCWEDESHEEAVRRVKYAAAIWFFYKSVERVKSLASKPAKEAQPRMALSAEKYAETINILAEALLHRLHKIAYVKRDFIIGIRWRPEFFCFEYFIFKAKASFSDGTSFTPSLDSEASSAECILHEVCQPPLLTFFYLRVALQHCIARLCHFLVLKQHLTFSSTLPSRQHLSFVDPYAFYSGDSQHETQEIIAATDLDKAFRCMVYFSMSLAPETEEMLSTSVESSPTTNRAIVTQDETGIFPQRSPEGGSALKTFPIKESEIPTLLLSPPTNSPEMSQMQPPIKQEVSSGRRYSLRRNGIPSPSHSQTSSPLREAESQTGSTWRRSGRLRGMAATSEDVLVPKKDSFVTPLIPKWLSFCQAYLRGLDTRMESSFSQKEEDRKSVSDDESDAPSTVPLEDGVSLQYISAYPTVQSMFHSSLVSFAKGMPDVFPSSAFPPEAYPFVYTKLSTLNDTASTTLRCNSIMLQLFPSLYTSASAHIPCTLRLGSAVELSREDLSKVVEHKLNAPSHHFSPVLSYLGHFCGDPWEKEISSDVDALLLSGEPPLQLDLNCLSLERMSEEEIFSAIRAFPGPPVSGFGGSHLDWLLGQQQIDLAPRTRSLNGTGYRYGNLFIQGLQKMRSQQLFPGTETAVNVGYAQKSSIGCPLVEFDSWREHSISPQVTVGLHPGDHLLRDRDTSLLSLHLPSGRGGYVSATDERESLPGSPLVEGKSGNYFGEIASHAILENRRGSRRSRRGSVPVFTRRGRSGRRPSLSGRGGRSKASSLCRKSLRVTLPCQPGKFPKSRGRRGGRGSRRPATSLHPMTTRMLPIKAESSTAEIPAAPLARPDMHSQQSADYTTSQDEPSGGGLPTGVYFDASRQLWRCQWRENGRFKTKGFSLAHYDSLVEALQAAIKFRCLVGGIKIRNEWFEPSFALQYASRGNPRRRGMHGGFHRRLRTPAEQPEQRRTSPELNIFQNYSLATEENKDSSQNEKEAVPNDAHFLDEEVLEKDLSYQPLVSSSIDAPTSGKKESHTLGLGDSCNC